MTEHVWEETEGNLKTGGFVLKHWICPRCGTRAKTLGLRPKIPKYAVGLFGPESILSPGCDEQVVLNVMES
jgi:hypothetical protein